MSATGEKLPAEMMGEILLRLPLKNLGRLKSVSRSFRALISSPRFIKTHFNRNNRNHLVKLLAECNHQHYPEYRTAGADQVHKLFSVDLVNGSDEPISGAAVATQLRLLPTGFRWDDITCSCNGLVLATDSEGKHWSAVLINPTTQKHRVINPPADLPADFDCDRRRQVSGLGYDSLTDDYKVALFSYYDVANEEEIHFRDRFLHVYSLRNSNWREVIIPPNDLYVFNSRGGVFSNGCLHWFCYTGNAYYIAAFNLETEQFGRVELPSFDRYVNSCPWLSDKLVSVNGCLCFSVRYENYLKDVWVMKKYGVRESWEEFSVYRHEEMAKPLCVLRDREVVIEDDSGEVVAYDVEEERSIDVEISGMPSWFDVWGSYVESLVSLHY